MPEENKIRDAADAVKGIAEAIPVYQDVVQPAAKEIGTALGTVAKTVHIALAPVSALVWGFDQIKDFVSTKVSERLKNTPPEDIQPPMPNVAGPTLESLRYTGFESTLRDLYANLLATAIDIKTASLAHPAFAEIIRQMTPDEARLVALFAQVRMFPVVTVRRETLSPVSGIDVLRNFSFLGVDAGCSYPDLTPQYLDNLCRLGIIAIPERFYVAANAYDKLENDPRIKSLIAENNSVANCRGVVVKAIVEVTELGRQFIRACLIDHDQVRQQVGK